MTALGPNVKKLIAMKMGTDAIPKGGGIEDALRFLTDKNKISAGAKAATEWVQDALAVCRLAKEPNPWKDADDEVIAGELLRQIEIKRNSQKKNLIHAINLSDGRT